MARSRFSRRFIRVRKSAQDAGLQIVGRGIPLVATRANFSPLSVMNRMISRLPFVRSIAQGSLPAHLRTAGFQGKGVVQHAKFLPLEALAQRFCNLQSGRE